MALAAPSEENTQGIDKSISDKKAASETARGDMDNFQDALAALITEYQEEYSLLQEKEDAVARKERELNSLVEQQIYYQRLLDQLNVFTYRDGDIYFFEVVLGTRSFKDLLTRLEYLVKLNQRQADILRSTKRLKDLVRDHRDTLRDEKEQQRRVLTALESKQVEIQNLLERQQELIGTLDQDLKNLEEEKVETAKRKAELAARAVTARERSDASWPEGLEINLVFPVPAAYASTYINDWAFARAGNPAGHQGTDIFGIKGTPLLAVADGVISDEFGNSRVGGYRLHIIDNQGVDYYYAHLNNDTPGTDDGQGGAITAFAPGIAPGVRVRAGQVIGYIGDSGDAEPTPPHLHFGISVGGDWVPPFLYLQTATYY